MANRGSCGDSAASGASGSRSSRRSIRSPIPWPCRAETGNGSPNPRRYRSATSASSPGASALFATNSTGVGLVRSRRASAPSSSVIPARTSTTSTTRSAAAIERSACSAASASSPVALCRYPAVSTSPNRRPRQVASSSIRSRVTPGASCAIAARLPKSRFTNVDLPTFCRPTIAICGTRLMASPPARCGGPPRAPW